MLLFSRTVIEKSFAQMIQKRIECSKSLKENSEAINQIAARIVLSTKKTKFIENPNIKISEVHTLMLFISDMISVIEKQKTIEPQVVMYLSISNT